ncbi:MAG: hypothetical protein IID45_14990 [Planctomycetes bacterium]|nr:hypothetical protein [Planctomycetota bacterium]
MPDSISHLSSRSQNRRRASFGSVVAERLLRENGLDSLESVFERVIDTVHRHRGRSVTECRLQEADGSEVRTFVKLNWGRRRFWPRMTDLKTGQLFQSLPVREWKGLSLFQSIGLNVPERLGLFRAGWIRFRHAVIVREVPAEFSVDELLQTGRWGKIDRADRSDLLKAMIEVMSIIHRAKLGWRGASSRHFFPERLEDGRWKLWLIDCEGVHRGRQRKIVKRDLTKLRRAMRESGADPDTLCELDRLIAGSLRVPVTTDHAKAA